MKKQYYYAVNVGRSRGVFQTWNECKDQVQGYPGAKYKKFETFQEAKQFSEGTNAPTFRSGYIHVVEESPAPTPDHPTIPVVKRRAQDDHYARPAKKQTAVDSTDAVVVYTDGATAGNGRAGARAGYGVYWGEQDPRNVSERLPGPRQTNQRAEITAVISALEQAQHERKPLHIKTDSMYVINAATSWSKSWIKNNWKTSTGKPVENRDLLERLLHLVDSRAGKTEFIHVRGHSGHHGNERADQLAVAGACLPPKR
ncbi:ribonuclease H-like domain-containing protein [Radiomyces spectabilis]|uniref:ribonuclease H-like domain-containing protein n=1 Tax=Radiomyces spectabilis TaxID=64574 RepID=UPI00221EB39F|nr:ribonuclease H-like domain-containing protein [Radiomyces spectabilis]KAI8393489.1 ribonuclease H-like domain-containing protein [Radiomyces spectabilis]